MSTVTIRVPASSANIGPGFDSAGIAIERFLTLRVTTASEWSLTHHSDLLPNVAHYEEHFIYKVAVDVSKSYGKTMNPAHVAIESDIPLARGLGSSASAIVAGIELANQQADLGLTNEDRLHHAVKIEGHPDNVAAALYGGFILAVQIEGAEAVDCIKLPNLDLDVVVYIPNFELKTSDARKVLPDSYTNDQATRASAIGNLMIASLLKGDYALSGKMMEEDLFHEPYRSKLIPRYKEIREAAQSFGAYGTVISGAGPTTISFVPKTKSQAIAKAMQELLVDYEVVALQLDETGLSVTK